MALENERWISLWNWCFAQFCLTTQSWDFKLLADRLLAGNPEAGYKKIRSKIGSPNHTNLSGFIREMKTEYGIPVLAIKVLQGYIY